MFNRVLKIRHYITAIVLGCSLGGFALTLGLAVLYRSIEDKERELQDHYVTLRELGGLRQLVESWSATVRLAIFADPAALEQADQLATRMTHHVDDIRSDPLVDPHAGELELIERSVGVIQEGLEIAAGVDAEDPNRATQRLELIMGFQQISSALSESIDRLEGGLKSDLEIETHALRGMQAQLWQTSWAGGLGYLTLVLVLWQWTIRRLIIPLQVLTEESLTSVDGRDSFHLVPDGPSEVRQLTESLASLINRLISARGHLEDKIKERTIELERANKAKNEFLANMSHEIRTPMTAILGYADLCQEKKTTAKDRRRYLEVINANGQHLLSVINDILDISKIEAGRMNVDRRNCQPFDVVSEVVNLMEAPALEKGLELIVSSDGPVPDLIQTDATRLRQILLNLIGNAIKFTDEGEVALTVSVVPGTEGEGELVQFEVRDTGVGLTQEEIGHIFKPFVQADSSSTREYGGTGLGLTISRVLSQLLGGDLTCSSEQGVGSCFVVRIDPGPLYSVERSCFPDKESVRKSRRAALELGPVPVLHGTALLAEDVAVNRRLLSMILERAGMEVDQAENGQVAFDLAVRAMGRGEPYGVIFMDMQMPVMDGYEATRRLREAGYGAPIIALTAHAMPEERVQCLRVGCDDYATKPIERIALLRMAAELLHQNGPIRKDTPAA